MKIFELAKEFQISSNDVMKILNDNGSDYKSAMSKLTDEEVEFLKTELTIESEKKEAEIKSIEKAEQIEKESKIKADKDYRPDEMIKCHSVFAGTLLFTGAHTGFTYEFHGIGDTRNIEYQDLKAALLQHKAALFDPDIVIEDSNLISDEHWVEIKEIYENMYDETEIKQILNMPTTTFKSKFQEMPDVARQMIITLISNQIEAGTFESYNKARFIDSICGTRFDLMMQ